MNIISPALLWLSVAIVLEVLATSLLPKTNNFRRIRVTLGVMALYFLCFYSLSKAMVMLTPGVTYALWCGLGIVLVNLVGLVIFRQKMGNYSLLGIALIVAGCITMGIFK